MQRIIADARTADGAKAATADVASLPFAHRAHGASKRVAEVTAVSRAALKEMRQNPDFQARLVAIQKDVDLSDERKLQNAETAKLLRDK